jgi:hypothetical protein
MEKREWINALIEQTLNEGRTPESVYRFCKNIGVSEAEFYQQFGSLAQLSKEILPTYFSSAVDAIQASQEWTEFSAREKTLSFLFAVAGEWSHIRSYLVFTKKDSLQQLRAVKPSFYTLAREIVASGIQSGEMAPRILSGERYADILWLQFCGVYAFWLRDESKGFEQTDAAIEKAVHFCFDAFERNFIDSFTELGKFVFQNAWKQKA